MQTNNRKGFSLIELLIVVVIIGILAAIAIPKFANTKEKAYIAQMKSDLKNLASAQESYFADRNTYATLAQIQATPYSWTVSGGAAVTPSITAAGGRLERDPGRHARHEHGRDRQLRHLRGRRRAPNAAVTAEGVVGCWP
jgi:prepilin-type N-terminal cleavage/methylation domain-containing protein